MSVCDCRCHAYGSGSHVECDKDTGSSGSSIRSCSPCDGAGPQIASERSGAQRHRLRSVRKPAFDSARFVRDPGQRQEPCIYPRCDDGTPCEPGEPPTPVLTQHRVCGACRKRFAKLLGWIVMDYVTIRGSLGAPRGRKYARSDGGQSQSSLKAQTFGHPAEADSDWAAMIADQLNELEHDLREQWHDGAAVHPRHSEADRVRLAYAYLTRRFDDLVLHERFGIDYAPMLIDLHGKTRSRLGQTRFGQRLPTPCPSCGVASLVRAVGEITCANERCGRVIAEKQYPFLARMVLDQVIVDYDRRHGLVVCGIASGSPASPPCELRASHVCQHAAGPRVLGLGGPTFVWWGDDVEPATELVEVEWPWFTPLQLQKGA